MNRHTSMLPHYVKPVCLIATVELSSAASKIVSSQLEFIRRVAGDSTLENTLELMCLIRCNNGI